MTSYKGEHWMGKIKEFFNKIAKGWKELSKSKKISVTIILGSFIVAAIVYYFAFGRVKYVPIFTNLEMEDSGQIVEKLEEMKVTDYKIEDGGSTILVSEKQVDKLRLDLAVDGILPNSGNGFELFDNAGFAITDEDRKILYQRALEGELQRSIMSLKEVDYARIHLALAEETVFTKEPQPGTASVVLKMKPLEKISPSQIKGIVSLVSGAVKNLPEENVRVVDDKANLLSDGVLSSQNDYQSVQSTNDRMEIKKGFEENLEKDLNGMLEKALGVDKVLTKVNVALDFDSQESTVISYDKEGVIRSQQVNIYRDGNVVQGVGGSPIDNNTQNYIDPNLEEVFSDEDTHSYESTTNNEIGETTTYTVKAPGEVKRISTSVLYDGNLTPEMQGVIQNIVMAATGFDMDRGDMINVEGINFDTSYQDQIQEDMALEEAKLAQEEAARQKLMMYIGIPIALILAVFIIIGIIRMSKRKKEDKIGSVDIKVEEPIPIEEIIKEPLINLDMKESTEERSIKDFAQKNPEKMAELMRAWIVEDER